MADIKLFRIGEKVEEVKSSAVELEKKLQTLIEKNDYEKAKPFLRQAYDEN